MNLNPIASTLLIAALLAIPTALGGTVTYIQDFTQSHLGDGSGSYVGESEVGPEACAHAPAIAHIYAVYTEQPEGWVKSYDIIVEIDKTNAHGCKSAIHFYGAAGSVEEGFAGTTPWSAGYYHSIVIAPLGPETAIWYEWHYDAFYFEFEGEFDFVFIDRDSPTEGSIACAQLYCARSDGESWGSCSSRLPNDEPQQGNMKRDVRVTPTGTPLPAEAHVSSSCYATYDADGRTYRHSALSAGVDVWPPVGPYLLGAGFTWHGEEETNADGSQGRRTCQMGAWPLPFGMFDCPIHLLPPYALP